MAKHEYVGGGWAGARGEATGFFHVEEIDGRWWMIDPVGDAFFVVGTDHVSYDGPRCEALGYSPYHRACQAKYGSEKAWAAAAARRLRAWGFNNVGAGAAASMRYRGLTHTEFISFGHGYAGIDAIAPQRWWTGFPNVFAKGFVDYCDRRAHETCRPNRRDPWLVGYFLDNELEWYGSYGDTFGQFDVGSSLLTDAMSLAPRNAARLAAVRLLQRRHATAASFNRAWETSIADVREIAALPSLPRPQTPAAQADAVEYLRLCAEKYFAITSAAVREHDPNHMVLGCRFAGSARGFMDIVGKHCDIVSINCYRYLDLGLGKFMDGFEDQLAQWHAQSRRPLMITEWSFPALDARLPCRNGGGQRVPTQRDKAAAFRIFQTYLFRQPFMVGSNYFMWCDEPAMGISRSFPEDSNYGLVNERDEPYALLTQAAMNLNPRVYAIHGGSEEGKVFISLWPRRANPTFRTAETFTITAASELDEPVRGKVRLKLHGAGGRVSPDVIDLDVPARGEVRQAVRISGPAAGKEFAVDIVADDPRMYGLTYNHQPRRTVPLPCGPAPRSVTTAWLKRGAPVTIAVDGRPLLRAYLRVAGGQLHLRAEVADEAVRVNRDVLWDGSCIELFLKQPHPLTLLRQFYLMPDPRSPGLVDLRGQAVAGSQAALSRRGGGYAMEVSAPLAALGVPHPHEPWCFDLVANSTSFRGRRTRAILSGAPEPHSRWSHYLLARPDTSRA